MCHMSWKRVDRTRQPCDTPLSRPALCIVHDVCCVCRAQVAASVCELIMPYFYSKIICSISKPGFQEAFRQHLVWYGAFALGFAVFAAGRGALFGVINNKLSRALR